MKDTEFGPLLVGDQALFDESRAMWRKQPIDYCAFDEGSFDKRQNRRTIERAVKVKGNGTFKSKAISTLEFAPCDEKGWWFDRVDLPQSLPTRASIRNVWTTGRIVSNIVLRSGTPNNYIRMIEHIIALRLGMHIDYLTVRMDSGDPPLFDMGSLALVNAIDRAGIVETNETARYITVKEPVSVCNSKGAFLTLLPAPPHRLVLDIDCAVDFKTAIGKQRICFTMSEKVFRETCIARTNTSAAKKVFCNTIGKIFADIRNLGYTDSNLLIAGATKYINEPRLMHGKQSLEAAWHRASLDLLAAIALLDRGRFVGKAISYKAGHTLDVDMMTQLYLNDLLVEI